VRAGLVRQAWDWPWSSAAAHVAGRGDVLVRAGGPLLAEVADWGRFLASPEDDATVARLRLHARTGRTLGGQAFVERLEGLLGQILRPKKPGPKPRAKAS